jgi:nitrogenase molybdenum-iron protein NifN
MDNAMKQKNAPVKTATQNACTLCAPLGASVVFSGIKNSMTILHGSQGCSTYIRRYIIGTSREPIDIASSSFSETSAIFGGESTLMQAIDNVITQYNPSVLGIATTCLAETIGDDVKQIIRKYRKQHPYAPPIITVSTPSFKGTHTDGFNAAVYALCDYCAQPSKKGNHIGIFPGFVSAADLRHFIEMVQMFDLEPIVVPDYSETLDGGVWDTYHAISPGGTSIEQLNHLGSARAAVSCINDPINDAAGLLHARFGMPAYYCPLPIGVAATDAFVDVLRSISGRDTPAVLLQDRGRLIDAYVDGHKFVYNKKVVLYGDSVLVAALTNFACEIGLNPVCIATGDRNNTLSKLIAGTSWNNNPAPHILENTDFAAITDIAKTLSPDLIIGNSKGYSIARELGIPLIRTGFPIADRIGGMRTRHIGYAGTQQLFDTIVNALIQHEQDSSEVGYGAY